MLENPPQTKCLIYCISPSHVISSISAIRTLHPNEQVEVTILVHWPGVPTEIHDQLVTSVKDLISTFDFVHNVVSVRQAELDGMDQFSEVEAIKLFKQKIGHNLIQEIYYAHDVTGTMYQWLCIAYPEAKKICFGDAFGLVFEKSEHLSYLKRSSRHSISSALFFMISRIQIQFKALQHHNFLLRKKLRQTFRPDVASLILPVDQSGRFLDDVKLLAVNKKTYLQSLHDCLNSVPNLTRYCAEILNSYKIEQRFILITENIAEGSFMNLETEINMWESIIRTYCPVHSLIIIKPHPGETLPRSKKIIERLSQEYTIITIDKRFQRLPIELFESLLQRSRVICMSYPTLSLFYTYGLNSLNPMNTQFIEQWFPKWTWNSYKNAWMLYYKPLQALSNWDGKSVLWSGQKQ